MKVVVQFHFEMHMNVKHDKNHRSNSQKKQHMHRKHVCLKCSCVESEFKDQPDTTLINHIGIHIDGTSSKVQNQLSHEGLNTETMTSFLHRK